MFLVNFMPTLVLFDSCASGLFVSLEFNTSFDIGTGALDHPLVIMIDDDHTLRALGVYYGCVLEMSNEKFHINIVPIHLG